MERPREELVHHFPHYAPNSGTTPHSSIRVGDHKLIRFWEDGDLQLFLDASGYLVTGFVSVLYLWTTWVALDGVV